MLFVSVQALTLYIRLCCRNISLSISHLLCVFLKVKGQDEKVKGKAFPVSSE